MVFTFRRRFPIEFGEKARFAEVAVAAVEDHVEPNGLRAGKLQAVGNNHGVGLNRAIDFRNISTSDRTSRLGPCGLSFSKPACAFLTAIEHVEHGRDVFALIEIAEFQDGRGRTRENGDVGAKVGRRLRGKGGDGLANPFNPAFDVLALSGRRLITLRLGRRRLREGRAGGHPERRQNGPAPRLGSSHRNRSRKLAEEVTEDRNDLITTGTGTVNASEFERAIASFLGSSRA